MKSFEAFIYAQGYLFIANLRTNLTNIFRFFRLLGTVTLFANITNFAVLHKLREMLVLIIQNDIRNLFSGGFLAILSFHLNFFQSHNIIIWWYLVIIQIRYR